VRNMLTSIFYQQPGDDDPTSTEADETQIFRLADIVHKRTLGNPYFLVEFLDNLGSQDFVDWNKPLSSEQVDRIQHNTSCTTNVVEFLLENKIRRIPHSCRRLLQIASCLGHTFEHSLLCNVIYSLDSNNNIGGAQTVDTQTQVLLHAAKEEGLIEPTDVEGVSKFSHDKIQAAFAQHLAGSESEVIHFQIGRCLLNLISIQDTQEKSNHLFFFGNGSNESRIKPDSFRRGLHRNR